MTLYMGMDVGGTKIAGCLLSQQGEILHQEVVPTPTHYDSFLDALAHITRMLDEKAGKALPLGLAMPGTIDHEGGCANTPNIACVRDVPIRSVLEKRLQRPVRLANDANCMALAEAIDGAGRDHAIVFGLIMGTGIGGGLVFNKQIIDGPNGMTAEFGHLALPYRTESDGPLRQCGCGQVGCIESTLQGAALTALCASMTGEHLPPPTLAARAQAGEQQALKVLDHYYETLAKAIGSALYAYDPHIIVVGGGLNSLPGLYDEVPKLWGRYCVVKNPKTKFVPATHGPMAGLRGAAWLWRT